MVALLRLLRIAVTILRYRLDELLPQRHLPWWLRQLLKLTILLPACQLSRGERLRRCLEDLGPVFVKFGQVLSTRPDLIPPDVATELDHLQDNVAPFDAELSRQIVEKALGKPVSELFAEFETTPMASASVAQVHAARLFDSNGEPGEEVVVKVIRPGIERTIEKDIALMYLVARLVQRFFAEAWRLRPVEVVEEYEYTILDELNLQREAANASQLRRNFAGSPLLYVPEVHWDYTRINVMVMERIHGIPVTDIEQLQAQDTDMKLLAERGVEIFFTQVFEHNFFHADMHPGNIFVSREHPRQPQYLCVDMAIVGSLSQADQYYMARILLAMFRRDYRLVAELHVQSGWVDEDTSIRDFEGAMRTVCEPFFEKPLREISFGQILVTLFQCARRFNMQVQPQLVLLQKTLLNIEGLGRQLYPDLDLWQTAHPFLERWLKQRFHPRSLWQQLKRYGPELMEQAPQMPHKLSAALDQVQMLGELTPQLQRAAEQINQQRARAGQRRRRALVAVLAGGAAVAVALPATGIALEDIPQASWLLLAIAGWAWLRQ
ncbi:ubiquinone biosynthesis regulatory protein kinase UbiB [Pseudomaricurvus sp. HS19]|uniref:ubiquinone biosynthesis regulatory protein kinase UbiB n=1 Tax=Pseudomaricurvus sp. HS19 TaxID=2692626 RepID=UPI001368FC10|nr:ubiquinone biosynthesis regulatory protein kinase UbiB [Pseudomaricurvus sp. HS19]MYM63604.1 ubiquinone biosynthesis regulatory protein kinase UbiB [Pseudomaricurvus sp. HS19]